MRRKNKHHVGRLRIRAAAILSEAFPEWDVRPEDIKPATGRWRSDWRLDVYRWELFARKRDSPHVPVVCGSWQTLTQFVRLAAKYGCTIDKDNDIYANERLPLTPLIKVLGER